MATANLNNDLEAMDTGKESVVIVDNFQSIRGGRTLDVTGFLPDVIKGGHVIIKETSTGELKPMPVNYPIATLGSKLSGSSYTNGSYSAVALTGGSGSGATANFTVAGGVVSAVTLVAPGTGYKSGDVLSVSAANVGGTGTGFAITVAKVTDDPDSYAALPGSHTYEGILIASILTAKPFAGILVRGTVNPAAAPFSMTSILSAIKAALPLIDFRQD